ncbi:DUF5753 domain-containing protein [Lentzea sp. NPDC006480]|uniref:DUF5753 domain-containing protein n=1 Tax=Lentzea sp. NPDC006480 TaxID=3157176 RepID=UPI0033A4D6A6
MPKRLSTVRGREFGAGVQAAIDATGLSARAIAEIVDWDEGKLSCVVNGKGGANQLEVALLLGACRTKPAEVVHLLALHSITDAEGWWQQHGTCSPRWLRTAVENLQKAKTLVGWQMHVIPVFLQTRDYMWEVLRASATVPEDELESRVEEQLAMQELLRRGRVECAYYIHESALRLEVGGAKVHAAQIVHLLCRATWANIAVRIVPAELGAHAGLAGPFTLLTFPKYEPLVWVETENSSLFVEAGDALEGYDKVVRKLDETSLGEAESKALLTRMHEAMTESGQTCG